MREQFAATAAALLEEDERVALLLADISVALFRDTLKAHPSRAVNVGIMEQTLVGVAAGFALEGFLPIVHSIAPFLVERPFEQLKDDFCYQGLGGLFVSVGASYDYSTEGMTHHCPTDVAILGTLPRMQVVVPGTGREVESLMRQTYANGAPTYLRTSTRTNELEVEVEFGRLSVVRTGAGATVIHLDVTIMYATTVFPFDERTLAAHASTEVVVVEPYAGAPIAPAIGRSLRDLPHRVETIGVPREVLDRYGTPENHDEALGLTPAGIRKRVQSLLGSRARP